MGNSLPYRFCLAFCLKIFLFQTLYGIFPAQNRFFIFTVYVCLKIASRFISDKFKSPINIIPCLLHFVLH